MGGTLTKRYLSGCSLLVRPPLEGWNVESAGWMACRAHCWVLRQPATGSCRPGRIIRDRCGWAGSWSSVSGLSTGHWFVVIPAGMVLSGVCRVWCPRVGWWVRPLLENCIVDASIFEFFQDCDRETVGPWAFGFVVPCFVVILVSVIVVFVEVF